MHMTWYYLIPLTVIGMIFALLYPSDGKILYPKDPLSRKKFRVLYKGLASLAFFVGAILATVFNMGFYALMITVSLFLASIGDVFLTIDILYPKHATVLYILGGLAFLGGHVVYLVLFLGMVAFNPWLIFVPLVFAVMPFFFAKKAGNILGKGTVYLVATYLAVLGLFLASTLNIFIACPRSTTNLVRLIAGVLFCASDFCLMAANIKRGTNLPMWVAVLYYSAQWLFVYTILI